MSGPDMAEKNTLLSFGVQTMRRTGRNKQMGWLTGSANFSVRGLYVQANNVLVFDDPKTADLYEQAFEQSFADPSTAAFKNSEIAENWFNIKEVGLPPFEVCFSPHKTLVSLDRVVEVITKADSSI